MSKTRTLIATVELQAEEGVNWIRGEVRARLELAGFNVRQVKVQVAQPPKVKAAAKRKARRA